ncbi:MAG: chemotaxis response regulator protein-glutamate methylesterase [Cellvibrionaceae bacterium]|nr:chemotaxis response regulator protein-glutamate methylesterase [Cellvibrionaceae bacterium]
MTKPARVLIVDDSALVRSMLTEILQSDSRVEVVGAAQDPFEAREMIKRLNPDVLTLDIEMPRMNGLTFLSNLMRLRPMPVVMISTLTHAGAPATLESLELGAVDFLAKPKDQGPTALADYKRTIVAKVCAAATANLSGRDDVWLDRQLVSVAESARLRANYVCAIGASTGGTEAVKEVLRVLPKQSPPILVAQHIPAAFSSSFAARLDGNCEIRVFEAEHDQPVRAGCAYVAPGGSHLELARSSYGYVCKLSESPPVNRHRPSVEVLFDSVLAMAKKNAMGVLLTGMGADGAEGLLRMREGGCTTIAQDEKSSVVWGMPGAAVKLNAADRILSLNKISGAIIEDAFV